LGAIFNLERKKSQTGWGKKGGKLALFDLISGNKSKRRE
jgi:hypothetical protein